MRADVICISLIWSIFDMRAKHEKLKLKRGLFEILKSRARIRSRLWTIVKQIFQYYSLLFIDSLTLWLIHSLFSQFSQMVDFTRERKFPFFSYKHIMSYVPNLTTIVVYSKLLFFGSCSGVRLNRNRKILAHLYT